jgi:hypothetical protein
MTSYKSKVLPRVATALGLLVGALGISILWAAGVDFPVAIPPGIVILLTGSLIVAFGPWRWAPAVGALMGLFVFIGFLISPTGRPNLLGENGTSVAIGQGIQVAGVLMALIAGVMATRANYSKPAKRSELFAERSR